MALKQNVEIKHISWFVWGALADWAHTHRTELRMEYVDKTTAIVLDYVQERRRTLDGSLTDLQCVLATEAKKLFTEGGLNV